MRRKHYNPYQTAKPRRQSFGNYHSFNNSSWYHWSGRIGRLRFLSYQFLAIGMLMAIFAAINVLFKSLDDKILHIIMAACSVPALFYILIIYPARRLGDMEKSRWLTLLMFIPAVNVLFFIYLIFPRGRENATSAGLTPRPNRWWHGLLALVLPLILLLGMLMAMGLPALQKYIKHAQTPQTSQPQAIPIPLKIEH